MVVPFLAFAVLAAIAWQLCRFVTAAKDRAGAWFLIAAWAQANGDAAMIRQRRRGEYVVRARNRVGVIAVEVAGE